MIEKFLTIKEAAEHLKDRRYDEETVRKWVEAGRCPYHVRGGVVLIPFPEADPYFPRLLTDEEVRAMEAKPAKASVEEKPKKAPKGTIKNPK